MTRRQKAVLRRNLFLSFCAVVLVAIIALVVFVICAVSTSGNKKDNSSAESEASSVESLPSENVSSKEDTPQIVELDGVKLDAAYNRLLLVNVKNPLPEDFDYTGNLITFPESYKKGSKEYLQIDKDMWQYLKAMMDKARAEGIDIGIISPFRDYQTQKHLFDSKVESLMQSGMTKSAAEKEAATRIAIPGTSEHHTGLAVDFNTTSQSFENTKTFEWLKENAENYGFIMRYSKDKMDITGGIIYEPWHWRFVGINTAKEINRLDMCLEEYLEYID